jgi:hypothetical protein
MAEDAATVAPHVYKVVFENERARVLEVRMKPGESTSIHSHPDYVVYLLSGGKVRFTSPSRGKRRSGAPSRREPVAEGGGARHRQHRDDRSSRALLRAEIEVVPKDSSRRAALAA